MPCFPGHDHLGFCLELRIRLTNVLDEIRYPDPLKNGLALVRIVPHAVDNRPRALGLTGNPTGDFENALVRGASCLSPPLEPFGKEADGRERLMHLVRDEA